MQPISLFFTCILYIKFHNLVEMVDSFVPTRRSMTCAPSRSTVVLWTFFGFTLGIGCILIAYFFFTHIPSIKRFYNKQITQQRRRRQQKAESNTKNHLTFQLALNKARILFRSKPPSQKICTSLPRYHKCRSSSLTKASDFSSSETLVQDMDTPRWLTSPLTLPAPVHSVTTSHPETSPTAMSASVYSQTPRTTTCQSTVMSREPSGTIICSPWLSSASPYSPYPSSSPEFRDSGVTMFEEDEFVPVVLGLGLNMRDSEADSEQAYWVGQWAEEETHWI